MLTTVCGRTASKSGKPFNEAGLRSHELLCPKCLGLGSRKKYPVEIEEADIDYEGYEADIEIEITPSISIWR